MIRNFDVETVRDATAANMDWPAPGESGYEILNIEHVDYDPMSWEEAVEALDYEEEILVKLRDRGLDEIEELSDDLYDDRYGYLKGLDLGVSGAVQALYAAGCVPYASCNGGCFGDFHQEHYPLIVFFADPVRIDILLEAAKHASVGLTNHIYGMLCVYSGDIERMVAFGRELVNRRQDFV
jgi:hypothetical protein